MNNRIAKLLDVKDVTASKFAEMIGVQPSNISHIISGRNKPSLDFILKVIETFPDISLDWLITGKGNMHKIGVEEQDKIQKNLEIKIEEKNESILEQTKQNHFHGELFDELPKNEINDDTRDETKIEANSEAHSIPINNIESPDNTDYLDENTEDTEFAEKKADIEISSEINNQNKPEEVNEKTHSENTSNNKIEPFLEKLIFIYSDSTFIELENRKK